MTELDRQPPPEHPWDGYLIGPENALAQAGAMALARGETAGVSPPWWCTGRRESGKSRLAGGAGGGAAAPAAGARRWRTWRPRRSRRAAPRLRAGRPGGGPRSGGGSGGSTCSSLEDVHDLERAPWAMAELSHTLDALDAGGAAVAVSARLGAGAVVGLARSGWSTDWSAGSRRRSIPRRLANPSALPARPGPRSRGPGPARRGGRADGRRPPTATGRSTAGSRGWSCRRRGSSVGGSMPSSSRRSSGGRPDRPRPDPRRDRPGRRRRNSA